MTISASDFDKVERFRETVLSDIKSFQFAPEDELDIKLQFANFAHSLINHKFGVSMPVTVAVEVVQPASPATEPSL